MFRTCSIERPEPHLLVVRKSRPASLAVLLLCVGGLVMFYEFVFVPQQQARDMTPNPGTDIGTIVLTVVLPLVVVAGLAGPVYKSCKILFFGEEFHFDKKLKVISRDGAELTRFMMVNYIQLYTDPDSDGDDHTVSIVLHNDDKIVIEKSADGDEMNEVAETVADFIGATLIRERRKPFRW